MAGPLEEMGHPQPATPAMTNNSTLCGIVNKMVKKQRTCDIDLRFYWVRDHCAQGHFLVHWVQGAENKGDYHDKHHMGACHRRLRPGYLHEPRYLTRHVKVIGSTGLQGCVEFGLIPDLWAHDPRNTSFECSLSL
eukprot:6939231-Ditylum_brightwellii.AAC.1